MTAVDVGRRHQPAPRSRTLDVVRLQFINTQTFVWVPILVLSGSWVISMLIYWILRTAGVEGVVVGGGAQAPLWYFLVIGAQALALSFPFSQAMSLTRREFFVGSIAAAAVSALGMAVVFVLLGLLELATDGYGWDSYFAHLPWVWEEGALVAGLGYFVATMLVFILGFWFATIYKRFGTAALTLVILAVSLVLLGFVALVTWQRAWPEVWEWILTTGVLGLTLWGVLLAVVLAAGSYLTLRRMPA